LLLPLWVMAQQGPAIEKVKSETQLEALQQLWFETSARWERNQERVALFESRQPEKADLSDTTMVVRLMGFSKTGEPIYYQTYNLVAAQSITTNRLWSGASSGLNLNGEGITLNVWDGGSIRHTHQEFGGRTTQMDGDPIMNGHATHVAGTMVAAGTVPTAKGMAPAAQLHVYDFGNDEEEMIAAAAQGAILSNHSYGRPTGWLFNMNQWWWYGDTRVSNTTDYKFGFYSEETRVRDEITYLAPYYLQVHAAGNDRLDTGPAEGEEHNVFNHDLGVWVKSTDYRQPDGGYDGYDCISTLVLGKNVITVGSVMDIPEYTGPESVVLSEFSSTGPADDGRIKPDIVANGQSLLSTWVDSNTSYAGLTGTSMAAPTITGSLGLIQQLNKRLYGNYLRASTLKALMIHTAREAGEHPGPDYRHGWGLADMEAAARILPEKNNNTLVEERNLVQNVVPTYTKTVYATGQKPMVATLVWTDVPGTPLEPALNDRTPLLVNDLDLRITRLSDGEVFYPWKLDPDNPSAPATTGDNIVDNVEKIEILIPEAGQYLIEVSHKGEIVDPINATNKRQAFSLVVSGIAERAVDMAITDLEMMASGCEFNQTTPARITLENKGQQDGVNVPVSWTVKNMQGQTMDSGSLVVDALPAGLDTILEVFVDMSQGLEFILSATVNYPGDQLPANNTKTIDVISENWVVSDETYHTSFEGIIFVEEIGWQTINANDNDSGWMLRIATAPSQWSSDGANSMRYGKFNPADDGVETMEAADDWLVSSCLYLMEDETYRVLFDYRSWNSEYPENMRVMLGTGTSPEDFTVELLDLDGFATDAFETGQVQFTVPEEGTYYIAFHVYSPADHRFVYLDNVFVERMVFADLGATSIEVDADGCEFTSETPVNVSFTNLGMEALQGFDISLVVSHLLTETEDTLVYHFGQVLEPNATAHHEFLANMSNSGKYRLQLVTMLEGDERPENDTIAIEVTNTSMDLSLGNYFTNFDDVTSLQALGWTTITNSGGSTGWRLNNLSGQAYSPPNSLNMYRFEANPDDWAFSNCLVMEEDTWYRIKFKKATRGTNAVEKFTLHLMDAQEIDAEVAELAEIVINTFDYQDEEVVFQAPYSGNFHIGFYTDHTGPNTFQIFVDDFAVETVLEHDAAALEVIQTTWGCNSFTDETPVKVVIENKGTEDLVNAQVVLTVQDQQGGELVYTMNSAKTLGLTQRDTLEFLADLSQLNTIYTLTAEVVLEGDENPANNTTTTLMRNTTVDLTTGESYFNDFEMVEVDGHSDLVDPKLGWWYENANEDLDASGGPITWVMRKNIPFAHSGEISMRSGRSLTESADDWLFSNCFIMQEGENYLLTFYYTGRATSYEEQMSVYLGTEQDSQTMDQLLWTKTFSTPMSYRQAVVAFSPPADGTYYIGFHAHSEPDQGWIYLDDFEIQKNHDVDLSLDHIEVLEEACSFSEETPVRIHFRNSGNIDLDHDLTISYEIVKPSGQVAYQGEIVFDEPLVVNQQGYVDVVADLRLFGIYTIHASVSLPEDVTEPETANNSRTAQVFSTALNPEAGDLYLTFEEIDDIEQTGWIVYDANNDGFTWDLGVNFTTYAYSGNRVMYYSFSASNDADDWLFSGCANLMADTVYVASYFYRVYDGDYAESMEFGIASAPHPDAVIEIFDVKEEMVNYNYRKVSYAFTVEADGQYFFAWHATSPKYHRFIFMDDFGLRKARSIDGSVYSIHAAAPVCDFDEDTPMKAVISNLGYEALPAGNLAITIGGLGGGQQMSIPTPEVPVLGSAEVDFNAAITQHGRYIFNYNLQVDGDQDPSTNTGSFNIFGIRVDLTQPGSWFIQDFETIFAMREVGWRIFNLNQDNRYWGLRVNDPPLAHSGHNYLVYFTGNQTQAANDWVISGCYELEAGRKYKGAFFYRLGSGNHNLRLATGTSPAPGSMTEVIWEETGMTAGDVDYYQHAGGIFEVSQSGRHYFGIHQFSPAGQGSSLADDLVIIAQPDILPLDGPVETGTQITVTALGTDSLRWYADAALTQEIGQGTTLTYTVTEETEFQLFAAELVYGVMGPADTLNVDIAVGIENLTGETALNIYPNPASDRLHIMVPETMAGKVTVEVFNVMGDKLMVFEQEASDLLHLNVAYLPKGTYVVVLRNQTQKRNAPFIKL
jgi:hypothetical protein